MVMTLSQLRRSVNFRRWWQVPHWGAFWRTGVNSLWLTIIMPSWYLHCLLSKKNSFWLNQVSGNQEQTKTQAKNVFRNLGVISMSCHTFFPPRVPFWFWILKIPFLLPFRQKKKKVENLMSSSSICFWFFLFFSSISKGQICASRHNPICMVLWSTGPS